MGKWVDIGKKTTALITILLLLVPSGAVLKNCEVCITRRFWMETYTRFFNCICDAFSHLISFLEFKNDTKSRKALHIFVVLSLCFMLTLIITTGIGHC